MIETNLAFTAGDVTPEDVRAEALARAMHLNGRRRTAALARLSMRIVYVPEVSAAQYAPMGSRRSRRARIRELRAEGVDAVFRPVYGYRGLPTKYPHKAVVKAMRLPEVVAAAKKEHF